MNSDADIVISFRIRRRRLLIPFFQVERRLKGKAAVLTPLQRTLGIACPPVVSMMTR